MKSPIPEPTSLEELIVDHGPRPAALAILFVLETIVSIADNLSGHKHLYEWLFTICWLGVVYCLWQDRNWARIVVLILAALTVLSVPFVLAGKTPVQQAIQIFNGAVSVGWLALLFNRVAIAFTRGIPQV